MNADDQKKQMPLPPEKELHHPRAPWRQGSYEHFNGQEYPDIAETPVVQSLQKSFPDEVLAFRGYRGDPTVLVKPERIVEMIIFLRDDPEIQMNFLRDLFGVDNLQTPERIQEYQAAGVDKPIRYEVIYILYSLRYRHDLRLRVPLSEKEPKIDSIHQVYNAANWFEREAWDMYGIEFDGHPQLERLLNHVHFEGHPLRKDYPVRRRHNIRTPLELKK